MKKLFFALTLFLGAAAAPAQTTQDDNLRQRLQQLEDRDREETVTPPSR